MIVNAVAKSTIYGCRALTAFKPLEIDDYPVPSVCQWHDSGPNFFVGISFLYRSIAIGEVRYVSGDSICYHPFGSEDVWAELGMDVRFGQALTPSSGGLLVAAKEGQQVVAVAKMKGKASDLIKVDIVPFWYYCLMNTRCNLSV